MLIVQRAQFSIRRTEREPDEISGDDAADGPQHHAGKAASSMTRDTGVQADVAGECALALRSATP
jgi:hypothetical protein